MEGGVRATPATALFAFITLLLLVGGCAGLPKLDSRTASTALTDTDQTRLGKAVQAEVPPIPARAASIRCLSRKRLSPHASCSPAPRDRSLDVRSYIWHGDTTGYLLFAELWDAAERGVRVRLLLDDNGIGGLDPIIAALDSHANIEVRLFNPFVQRTFGVRLHHRLRPPQPTHAQQVVHGGRAGDDRRRAQRRRRVFRRRRTYGVRRPRRHRGRHGRRRRIGASTSTGTAPPRIRPTHRRQSHTRHGARDARQVRRGALVVRRGPVRRRRAGQRSGGGGGRAGTCRSNGFPRIWCTTIRPSDLDKAQDADLLFTNLTQALGTPEREVDIVSPYFVPGKEGTGAAAYAERRVQLRILTNSLAATDVGAVHAGYAKRREPLLRSGAKIYELKPDSSDDSSAGKDDKKHKGPRAARPPACTPRLSRSIAPACSSAHSTSTLAPSVSIQKWVSSSRVHGWPGPFPARSTRSCLYATFEVTLVDDGRSLQWVERTPQGEVRYNSEPQTGFMKRLGVGFMSGPADRVDVVADMPRDKSGGLKRLGIDRVESTPRSECGKAPPFPRRHPRAGPRSAVVLHAGSYTNAPAQSCSRKSCHGRMRIPSTVRGRGSRDTTT